jgi:hypothetical protein
LKFIVISVADFVDTNPVFVPPVCIGFISCVDVVWDYIGKMGVAFSQVLVFFSVVETDFFLIRTE